MKTPRSSRSRCAVHGCDDLPINRMIWAKFGAQEVDLCNTITVPYCADHLFAAGSIPENNVILSMLHEGEAHTLCVSVPPMSAGASEAAPAA